MKIVCIYHSIDLDGWMSAAIVKHWHESINDYPDNVGKGALDFIGYNYGQPIPNLSEYDKVIMCDVSFPKEEMEKLKDQLAPDYSKGPLPTPFIWIDHHISAIKDNENLDWLAGLRDTNFAACELTWKYFFPNKTMPEIVRLLGRYDCFGHKGTEEERKVLEFQYGARQCVGNYEEACFYLTARNPIVEMESIERIHSQGKTIYQYLCTDAKQSYNNGFKIKLYEDANDCPIAKEREFICINKERFNPINFGIDYHKDGYDGCACFHYANEKYNFSLYNDNGLVDCSLIAKQFGGGGHKGAAGFTLTPKEFNDLIS